MPTGTKSGCFGGYSHLLVVVSLFGLLIAMQNMLLYQKMRWALHVAEKTHMFVISSFYYDVSKSLPNNSIAIIFAARKHFVDFPITCKSRDAFGRTRDTKATSEILLVAPVQCKWTIMVAFCPVVPDPQRLSIEGDPGKRQVVRFVWHK
ncbi:hypothetical protein AAVH_02913 [Aphelenchoides avenae]|nr:hypothetical protein AAVH_02913 [Aphelenchus avenae]